MKAVVCKQPGPPSMLTVDEVDEPTITPRQVLVKVHTCSLSYPDLLMIQDKYQYKPGYPFTPGSEVGGTVIAVGADVTTHQIGDRVVASPGTGGMAELVASSTGGAAKVPDHVDLASATGFLYAYGTAYHALHRRADLQPGETVLVVGAAGAVGLAAVELATLMGADVIAAAGSDAKLELCRQHGARTLVNYTGTDVRSAIRAATNGDGDGVDVVVDTVGGALTEPAVRSLKWRGRLLVVGFTSGDIAHVPVNLTLLKGTSVVGVYWGASAKHEPQEYRATVFQLLDWLAEGRLHPYVSDRYSLVEAPAAFAALAQRQIRGKAIIDVTPSGA